jgi:hypothetical protein
MIQKLGLEKQSNVLRPLSSQLPYVCGEFIALHPQVPSTGAHADSTILIPFEARASHRGSAKHIVHIEATGAQGAQCPGPLGTL